MPIDLSQATAQHWQQQGFIVARGVIPLPRVRRLLEVCERVWKQWLACDPATGKPGNRGAIVMRHLNDPVYFKENRDDLVDLLELASDEQLLTLIGDALGYRPVFRHTSFFFEPASNGRDGNWHRDSQFLTSTDEQEKAFIFDDRLKGMQLQIALVASEDSEYVPGSHRRWDTPREYEIRKANGRRDAESNDMPGAVRIDLQAGDLVAFHSGGLHRGRYHTDKVRRTLMYTYSGVEDALHDHFVTDQTWFLDEHYLDGLSPHAKRFYEQFKSMFQDDWKRKLAESAAGTGIGQGTGAAVATTR